MQVVADQAGVCLTTVSRALKNMPCISLKTRQRIQKVADDLGYRPNPMISALMAQLRTSQPVKYSPTIGFLTYFATPNHWREIPSIVFSYEGASRRCEQLGFHLEHFWFAEPGITKERAAKILRTRNITGVVLSEIPQEKKSVDFDWDAFSCAALSFSLSSPALHRSAHDNFNGIMTAYENLIALGYRRIGLAIRQIDEEHNNRSWMGGYGVSQFYHPEADSVPPFLVEIPGWNENRFAEWYRKYRPDVVLTLHSHPWRWLQNLGLRVPEDVGYASLDTCVLDFPAAGIDQSYSLVGAAAVDLVVEQMNCNERGIPAKPKVIMIEGAWRSGPTVEQQNAAPGSRKKAHSPRRPAASRLAKAFSLVELLATVAVVGFLAALLFPALRSTIDKARTSECAGNLRALGAAFQLYATDNDNRLPPSYVIYSDADGPDNNWYYRLSPYTGKPMKKTWESVLATTMQKPFHCPLVKNPDPNVSVNAWISYKMNLQLREQSTGAAKDVIDGAPLGRISQPSKILLVAEGRRHTEFGRYEANNDGVSVWYPHNGAMNALFIDGHVESLTEKALAARWEEAYLHPFGN